MLDLRRIRHIGRIGQLHHRPVLLVYPVYYTRRCRYQIQVVLTLQTLLNDLQMEQSEEAAAKAKSQRSRCFRLILKRRVIELQLFQRVAQIAVARSIRRIQAAVYHGLYLFIAGKRI